MSKDPSLAIQQAVYTALTNHAGVTAIVGAAAPKVFERVPDGTALPFIVIGQDVITGDDSGPELSVCDVTVHVFAADVTGAKRLAVQVVDALYVRLPIPGFSTEEFHRSSPTRHLVEGDAKTGHSIVEVEYTVQSLPA